MGCIGKINPMKYQSFLHCSILCYVLLSRCITALLSQAVQCEQFAAYPSENLRHIETDLPNCNVNESVIKAVISPLSLFLAKISVQNIQGAACHF